MTTLNAGAAEHARAAGAHALTDVTGFGLLGHVHELAAASGLAAEIDAAAVPAIEGVLALLERGRARGRLEAQPRATRRRSPPGPTRCRAAAGLLCDAMTSGGLLAAVAGAAMEGWTVGRLVAGEPGTIASAALALRQAGEQQPEQDPDHAAGQPGQRFGTVRPPAAARARSRSQARRAGRRRPPRRGGAPGCRASTTRASSASADELAPTVPPFGSSASDGRRRRPRRRAKNTSSGAHAPWRRSSSQPNRKIAASAATS